MDEKDKQLIALLNKIIAQLSQPLTPEEKEQGWNEPGKRTWRDGLREEFYDKLRTGQFKENQEKEINLTRDLGWNNLLQGPLAEMITEFDIQWNMKYSREKRKWWYHRKKKEFK